MIILAESVPIMSPILNWLLLLSPTVIGILALVVSYKVAGRTLRGEATLQWIEQVRMAVLKLESCCYDMIYVVKQEEVHSFLSRLAYCINECNLLIDEDETEHHQLLKNLVGEHYNKAREIKRVGIKSEASKALRGDLADHAKAIGAAFHNLDKYIRGSV